MRWGTCRYILRWPSSCQQVHCLSLALLDQVKCCTQVTGLSVVINCDVQQKLTGLESLLPVTAGVREELQTAS